VVGRPSECPNGWNLPFDIICGRLTLRDVQGAAAEASRAFP